MMRNDEIDLIHRKLYGDRNIIDYILNFFKTSKGVKCRVGMSRGKKPYYYDSYTQDSRLVNINNDNILEELYKFDAIYFLECIFDKEVTKAEINENPGDHFIGITATMDMDAPSIYNNQGKKIGRKDFFDNDVFNDFLKSVEIIDKELLEVDIDYDMIFSGNGMYIVCDEFYGSSYDETLLYCEKFVEIVEDVNWMMEKKNINVDIDSRTISWNRFFKIPFTIHTGKRRVSIPVTIDDLEDKEWLKQHVSIDRLL